MLAETRNPSVLSGRFSLKAVAQVNDILAIDKYLNSRFEVVCLHKRE